VPVNGALDRSFGKLYSPNLKPCLIAIAMPERDSEEELDLSGLLCPLPTLKAGKRLRAMARGEVLKIIATDPLSATDIPHFCNEQGHTLLSQAAKADAFVFRIKRK